MTQYKNFRVSDNVLTELKAMQKGDESIPQTLIRLSDTWFEWMEGILIPEFSRLGMSQSPDIRVLEVTHDIPGEPDYRVEEFEYIYGDLKNTLRLPINCFETLDILKVHPDETYNTALFKLICMNKAIEIWSKEFNYS
jgi:hypothetical protein